MNIGKLLILLEFASLLAFNSVFAEDMVVDTRETHIAVMLEKSPGVINIKDKASRSIDKDLKQKYQRN